MQFLFDSFSWEISCFFVVATSIVVCLGLLWAVRKFISTKELKKSHDVVGFTFSIIGVLYSVVLGFTVINAQSRYNTVQETIHTEAILIADLYQDAGFFSKNERDSVRLSLRNYTEHVMKEEWNEPSDSKINPATRKLIKNIWESYHRITLSNEKESIWYTESISKLNSFLNARLARQFNSWEHLGSMMWTHLIIGALITACFMFFFGLENFRSHLLMTALLVGYLSFMLYLVYSLDNVFKGPQGLKPVALEQVQHLFDEWDRDSLQYETRTK